MSYNVNDSLKARRKRIYGTSSKPVRRASPGRKVRDLDGRMRTYRSSLRRKSVVRRAPQNVHWG